MVNTIQIVYTIYTIHIRYYTPTLYTEYYTLYSVYFVTWYPVDPFRPAIVSTILYLLIGSVLLWLRNLFLNSLHSWQLGRANEPMDESFTLYYNQYM